MGRDRASRPEAKPLRLFVAVEIPEEARDAVEEAFAPWREEFPNARWVPRENWHVTLKFLGRTWPRLTDWVPQRVEEVARDVEPFRTRVSGVGGFPSPGKARVLWAGLEDDAGIMAGLAVSIEGGLLEEFPAETREFHPHLTVARSDPPLKLPPEFAETALLTEEWEVDHVVLFRSHLRRPAPVYEPLARFPLGGEMSGPERRSAWSPVGAKPSIDRPVPTRTHGSSSVTDRGDDPNRPSARAAEEPPGEP